MIAMIFAAGLGTRLQPITNRIPKALVMINNQTLLEIAIKKLLNNNIDTIIINVHHQASQIIEYLNINNNFGANIIISDETDELLDTGGGLLKAIKKINLKNETLLLHNVDVITNLNISKMLEFHKKSNAIATLAVQKRNSSRYLLFDNNMDMKGWKNIKTGEEINVTKYQSNLEKFAFSGIHIIDQSLIKKTTCNGKFSIIQVYLELCSQNKISGFDHTADYWFDVGKPKDLAKAEKYLAALK